MVLFFNAKMTGELGGGSGTGGTFGTATKSVMGIFSAIRAVAISCGIAGAVCAIVIVAILISTSNNPPERSRQKGRLVAIAIGTAVLAASGTLLAIVANIGASL